MSIDYSAVVGYGYIFGVGIDCDRLDQIAYLVCDVLDYDPYDCFFALNGYDEKSGVFVGIKLAETCGYEDITHIHIDTNLDNYKAQLQKILELFDLHPESEPELMLMNHVH